MGVEGERGVEERLLLLLTVEHLGGGGEGAPFGQLFEGAEGECVGGAADLHGEIHRPAFGGLEGVAEEGDGSVFVWRLEVEGRRLEIKVYEGVVDSLLLSH